MFSKRGQRTALTRTIATALSCTALWSGCAEPSKPNDKGGSTAQCAPKNPDRISGSTGTAYAFKPDPMSSSGNKFLAPGDPTMDSLKTRVALERLEGRGVLQGALVEIRNGIDCQSEFGAYNSENKFEYAVSDRRFQEAMSYYHADQFRALLDNAQVLEPKGRVTMVVHCMQTDNAFYFRGRDSQGNTVEQVCIGDSAATVGSSYADDAQVAVHELQHATTVNTYSFADDINRFPYDEAGALNEGISDFMALIYTAPMVASSFDPRTFSRWALGTFLGGYSGVRGAYRCPMYDSGFAAGCPNFKAGFEGFAVNADANSNTASFSYPDGLGWPMARNYDGPGYLRSIYQNYLAQDDLHSGGVIATGALWEIFEHLRTKRSGDWTAAQTLASRLAMEAVRRLPKPTPLHHSPVTYPGFGQALVDAAPGAGLASDDISAIQKILTERGMLGQPTVAASWASVGPEEEKAKGIRIQDDPLVLRSWLTKLGSNPDLITHNSSTGLNHQLDAGETVALWFNVVNNADITVAGVELTAVSDNPEVQFVDESINFAPVLGDDGKVAGAQIVLPKISGQGIARRLSSSNPTYDVGMGTSSFTTNVHFDQSPKLALWVKVSPKVANKTVNFKVTLKPSNADPATLTFTAMVN